MPAEERSGDERPIGLFTIIREWGDALVIAFMLVMFFRVFVVELYKIPTGSMSPTLLGDDVCYVDVNGDEQEDLVVLGRSMQQIFLREGDRYFPAPEMRVRPADVNRWRKEGRIATQHDRILVNKFAYWFKAPERGDVIVFKVPDAIWDPRKPFYIKRTVGLPGERLSFDGQLAVDGKFVDEPEFFAEWEYSNVVGAGGFVDRPEARYTKDTFRVRIDQLVVPEGAVYAFGDNTRNSTDGRVWGPVPLERLKGKAFFRYWPWKRMKFIR